ncbi:MAG: LysE family transporter [Bacteroidales bacterium]|jgi:threonine/homoserine/homoserine lactone efflux protein|nr:LysE family transporter [Bacteroidales bacterium]NPV35779.1 LysE family transporter [Bacteroidales bacterium]
MLEGLLYGISLGLVLGLATGPTFFILISATVSGGKSRGIYSAAGIVDSDLIMAILSMVGVGFVNTLYEYKPIVSLVAGVVLILAGVLSYALKSGFSEGKAQGLKTDLGLYIQIFWVNIINPFNWLFWIAVCGWIKMNGGGMLWWWVLVPAFLIEFILNVLKMFLVARLGRTYLLDRIKWLKLLVSLSMITLGAYLVVNGFNI